MKTRIAIAFLLLVTGHWSLVTSSFAADNVTDTNVYEAGTGANAVQRTTKNAGVHTPHVIVDSAPAGGGAATIADGADVTQGAKADTPASTDTGTFSIVALLKRALQTLTTIASSVATIATNTAAATPAGSNTIGKVSIDQATPGTTNAVAIPDGSNVTQGAKADAVASSDTGTFSLISLFKRSLQTLTTIATNTAAATPAGSNTIGKVGIDQTTPGTTNAVAITGSQYTIAIASATTNGTVAAGKHHVEFILSSNFAGTIGGVTIDPAVLAVYNPGDAPVGSTFAALSYTISAGSATITTW